MDDAALEKLRSDCTDMGLTLTGVNKTVTTTFSFVEFDEPLSIDSFDSKHDPLAISMQAYLDSVQC